MKTQLLKKLFYLCGKNQLVLSPYCLLRKSILCPKLVWNWNGKKYLSWYLEHRDNVQARFLMFTLLK